MWSYSFVACGFLLHPAPETVDQGGINIGRAMLKQDMLIFDYVLW